MAASAQQAQHARQGTAWGSYAAIFFPLGLLDMSIDRQVDTCRVFRIFGSVFLVIGTYSFWRMPMWRAQMASHASCWAFIKTPQACCFCVSLSFPGALHGGGRIQCHISPRPWAPLMSAGQCSCWIAGPVCLHFHSGYADVCTLGSPVSCMAALHALTQRSGTTLLAPSDSLGAQLDRELPLKLRRRPHQSPAPLALLVAAAPEVVLRQCMCLAAAVC